MNMHVDFSVIQKKVEALLKNGEALSAISFLKKELHQCDTDSRLYVLLGSVYHFCEQDAMAYRYISQAIYSCPTNIAYHGWALLTAVLSGSQNAEKHYRKVKDSDLLICLVAKSEYFINKLDYVTALSIAKQAYNAEQSNIEAVIVYAKTIDATNNGAHESVAILQGCEAISYDIRLQKLYLKILFKACMYEKCKSEARRMYRRNPNSEIAAYAREMMQKSDNALEKEQNNEQAGPERREMPAQTGRNKTGAATKERTTYSIDEAFAKLDELIGLSAVKEQLHRLYKKILFDKQREEALGIQINDKASYHFIFSGNPGTGKTTVARLLGDIFYHIGMLEKGQLVEATRASLVGEYQGHTATKTQALVKSAIGGVLFIDEAYSLYNGENDDFGKEAIDTLVKAISDNSDRLIVVLAGYTEEMRDFLKANAGLESRFTKFIDFPDYTEDELLQIAEAIAAKYHYTFSQSGKLAFRRKISRQMLDRKFGNARTATNIMNEAFEQKAESTSLDDMSIEQITVLTATDFGEKVDETPEVGAKQYIDELNGLIGLDSVKETIASIIDVVTYQKQESDITGTVAKQISLHMAFTGNPGTGKTTVARLYGNILRAIGFLKKGQFIEATRSDLIATHVGETARLVREKCADAYGGILFIDEAYSLCTGENDSFGHEAVSTLLTEMENNREKLVVILAGYSREMREFFGRNSGFTSRISKNIEFPDYSPDNMYEIFMRFAVSDGYTLTDNAIAAIRSELSMLYKTRDANFGNGRDVRKLYDTIVQRMMGRVSRENAVGDERRLISEFDVFSNVDASNGDLVTELINKLNSLIGLKSVKDEITQLIKLIKYQQTEQEAGRHTNDAMSMHMVFAGNPGTGKTTVARLYGQVLGALGILKKGQFIEAARADFVGQYQGHTAKKTIDKCREAYGGVLFIDEAYSLCNGKSDTFGMEAVSTLIKEMEDNRDNLVVIFAGYTAEMDEFLSVNSGFKSRISKTIEFLDYSDDELVCIFDLLLKGSSTTITDEAKILVNELLHEMRAKEGADFANGRSVRNLFETIKKNMACRVVDNDITGAARKMIVVDDVALTKGKV